MGRAGSEYPGIGRLVYFGCVMVLSIVNVVLQQTLATTPGQSLLISLGVLPIAIVFVVLRLRNLAMSGWWALLMFIPLVNILLALRCLVYPPGYGDHRTMDAPAKIIVGVILGLFLLALGLVAVALLM